MVVELRVGSSVCGNVARLAAAGSVGKYSGPRCPQPSRTTAIPPRAIDLNRIWEDFNIIEL